MEFTYVPYAVDDGTAVVWPAGGAVRVERSIAAPRAAFLTSTGCGSAGLNNGGIYSPQPILFFFSFNNLPAILSQERSAF